MYLTQQKEYQEKCVIVYRDKNRHIQNNPNFDFICQRDFDYTWQSVIKHIDKKILQLTF